MGKTLNRSVAIVGSGPGGIYVAQALLEKSPGCRIDIIDKLPTPFGLIRGGVAPDHQNTKRVDRKYSETATAEGVRFLGNVTVGSDVSLAELTETYDAVVLALGAPYDRRLGIPGEDKAGVIGSNAFVGWYNSHPEFRDLEPYLDVDAAVVIGVGNVAVDSARILAKSKAEMATSDIADYALNRIEASKLSDIWMMGRRGPVDAAFTNIELRELAEMENCDLDLDPNQLPKDVPTGMDARRRVAKVRILETLWNMSELSSHDRRRTLHIRFQARPVEILGNARVEGIRMEHTRIENGHAVGTGETYDIECGLIITCIGSVARPIEGMPFDEKSGTVKNTDGRAAPGLYAAGWAKRGATGTIGTNRLDSYAVTDLIVADFAGEAKPGPDGFDELAASHKLNPVSFDDWLTIKEAEEQAAAGPAPRRKFSTVADMLATLQKSRKRA